MTLYLIIWGVEKAAATPLLFPLPSSPANARHSDRREESPKKNTSYVPQGEISFEGIAEDPESSSGRNDRAGKGDCKFGD